MAIQESEAASSYWHVLEDGRVQCDPCPCACKLHEGQRGVVFLTHRFHERPGSWVDRYQPLHPVAARI